MRRRGLFFVVAILLLTVSQAAAEKRVALVIGNGLYEKAPALPNPPNDASDIALSLERMDFNVRRVTNGTYDTMRRSLLDFSAVARGADIAVVFYAGHGMEIGGENWLVPVDAELKTDINVEQEAIGLRSILLTVSSASKLGLVILDACRNNPFASKMQRSLRTRAVEQGLARVEPTGSVLVAYAAKDGTTAADGTGRNSPFTSALLRNFETPGLEINFLFRNVRDDVIAATKREQEPFVYGSLSRDAIFLVPQSTPGEASAVVPRPGPAADEVAWSFISETTDAEQLRRFVREYPLSPRRQLAERQIAEIERAKTTAPTRRPAAKTCLSFNGQQVCN